MAKGNNTAVRMTGKFKRICDKCQNTMEFTKVIGLGKNEMQCVCQCGNRVSVKEAKRNLEGKFISNK